MKPENIMHTETSESIENNLKQKAEIMQRAFQRDYKEGSKITIGNLDQEKLQKITAEIPDEEIRNSLERAMQIISNGKHSPEEADELFDMFFDTNKALYIDNRPYVKMAKRALSEHRMSLMLNDMAKIKEITVPDMRKIVRGNFDLNGLKPMNDLGGHNNGNEGLKLFSDVLKEGKTTKWLEGLGFKIVSSSEGGDEFGMVISGITNDRPIDDLLLREIQKRYSQEFLSIAAGQLVDFKSKEVQQRMLDRGVKQEYIDEAIAANFEFKMSSSIGFARLDEALMQLEVSPDAPYSKTVRDLIGRMFKIADGRADKNKTDYKAGLAESADVKDNILSDLIDRDKGARKKDEMIAALREMLLDAGFTEEQIQEKIEEKLSKKTTKPALKLAA